MKDIIKETKKAIEVYTINHCEEATVLTTTVLALWKYIIEDKKRIKEIYDKAKKAIEILDGEYDENENEIEITGGVLGTDADEIEKVRLEFILKNKSKVIYAFDIDINSLDDKYKKMFIKAEKELKKCREKREKEKKYIIKKLKQMFGENYHYE